jgi:hypothetical protein
MHIYMAAPNFSKLASIKSPRVTGTTIALSDPAIFCWPKSAPCFLEIASPAASRSLMNQNLFSTHNYSSDEVQLIVHREGGIQE